MDIVVVNSTDGDWVVLSGYVSAAGARRYLNLRVSAASAEVQADIDKSGKEKTHPYSFVAYRLEEGGRLSLAYPVEPLVAAVKTGRLAGETVGDYDAFISDAGPNIAAVLAAVDDQVLFKDPVVYRRISPATSP
jgi:hypothetical protein